MVHIENAIDDNMAIDAGNPEPANRSERSPSPIPPVFGRTHKSAEHAKFLSELALFHKLKLNKEIEARNLTRRQRVIDAKINGTALEEPASDEESIVTIADKEAAVLLDDSVRDQYKDVLSYAVLEWIASIKRPKPNTPPATAKRGLQGSIEKPATKRRLISGRDIAPRSVCELESFTFPDLMFLTAVCVPLPLEIFLPKHLRFIAANLGGRVLTKKSSSVDGLAKGHNIIEIDKLVALLNCPELSLDCSDWESAARQMYEFHAQIDEDGPSGPYAEFWRQHFKFFHTLRNKAETYEYWKHEELELRQSFYAERIKFNAAYYQARYDHAVTRKRMFVDFNSELDARFAAFSKPTNSPSPFNPRQGKNTYSRALPPGQSFRESAKSSNKTHICLLCAEPGHTVFAHVTDNTLPTTFAGGAALACKVDSDKRLLTKSGKDVCVNFNIRGDRAGCSHRDDRIHVCSFCGKAGHFAFSWSCRTRPAGTSNI